MGKGGGVGGNCCMVVVANVDFVGFRPPPEFDLAMALLVIANDGGKGGGAVAGNDEPGGCFFSPPWDDDLASSSPLAVVRLLMRPIESM
jgi:hypothetical protein